MAQRKMSYATAQKIIDLYAGLLENNHRLKLYSMYAYRELDGYDSVDICNALKLDVALRYFISENTTKNLAALDQYVQTASGAMVCFRGTFAPDEIADQLNNALHQDDESRITLKAHLTKGEENFGMNKALSVQETPPSFYDYCKHISNTNRQYWTLVYKRLELYPDKTDSKDRINRFIQYTEVYCEVNEGKYAKVAIPPAVVPKAETSFLARLGKWWRGKKV